MTIETLLRAAEAAGFATASDENERRLPPVSMPQSWTSPKDVLSASLAPVDPMAGPTLWARSNLTQYIPIWNAKG